MDIVLALLGVGIIAWAFHSLFNPPEKRRSYSLSDQRQATHNALGGSAPPDISDIESTEVKQKKH